MHIVADNLYLRLLLNDLRDTRLLDCVVRARIFSNTHSRTTTPLRVQTEKGQDRLLLIYTV